MSSFKAVQILGRKPFVRSQISYGTKGSGTDGVGGMVPEEDSNLHALQR